MMVTIRIANMNCGGCAKGVTATLRATWPDIVPQVDLAQHTIAVASNDPAPLVAALVAAGWQASATAG
jgi:copper chaperone